MFTAFKFTVCIYSVASICQQLKVIDNAVIVKISPSYYCAKHARFVQCAVSSIVIINKCY